MLTGIRYNIPTVRAISPTGVKEKKVREEKPCLISSSLMIRFGGVPIRVIIPPKLLAKASGINSRDELIFALMAILTTIGSIRATVPVLLTKAPMKEVAKMTKTKSFSSLFPASLSSLLLIIFANPVWKIAPPTTKSPIIITTTVLENPDRASSGVRIPKRTNNSREERATKSERIFPIIKKAEAITRIAKVIYIFIGKGIGLDKRSHLLYKALS